MKSLLFGLFLLVSMTSCQKVKNMTLVTQKQVFAYDSTSNKLVVVDTSFVLITGNTFTEISRNSDIKELEDLTPSVKEFIVSNPRYTESKLFFNEIDDSADGFSSYPSLIPLLVALVLILALGIGIGYRY